MVWVKLAVCVVIILFAGRKVARYGDIVAHRTGIGHVWVGVIALAVVTSLPELFTGISAVTLVDAPNLTIGNLIGANAFNLFNLALLDIFHKNSSILTASSPAHRLTAWMGFGMVALVALSIIISIWVYAMPLGWIGWYSPILIILYIFAVRRIYVSEQKYPPKEITRYTDVKSMKRIYLLFILMAALIIGAGLWLATIGEEIAETTGLAEGFVGSLLLAFITTLPEITVSFSALRLGAIDMAIANMVGSTLFNMFIIPILDLIYVKGPILAGISENHIITATAVMMMTGVFILASHRHPTRHGRLSWFSLTLALIFLARALFSYYRAI